MLQEAGRVQIGSLVWRHRDWQGKGWHWWRREPGWWPKGTDGVNIQTKTNKSIRSGCGRGRSGETFREMGKNDKIITDKNAQIIE